MKHLGDITKISGYDVPITDIVVGGSPCQDLSIAGRREGLNGERSGLYMEQIRIIKEMREKDGRDRRSDEPIRPRYMLWENVPGAFSSNGGEDFRIVIEEAAKVADETATIPRPKNKKWRPSGCIMGRGWSIAWRVFDSQFWGVPQRRRRIAHVADFGGYSAPEILFIRKGLQWNNRKSCEERETTATNAKGGTDNAGEAFTLKIRGGKDGGGKGALIQKNKSMTLSTHQDQTLFQQTFATKSYTEIEKSDIGSTLKAAGGTYGGGGENYVMMGFDAYNQVLTGDKSMTVTGAASDAHHVPCCLEPISGFGDHVSGTLMARDYKGIGRMDTLGHAVVCPTEAHYCFEPRSQDGVPRIHGDICPTLNTAQGGQRQHRVAFDEPTYLVRRLTPLECERMQGFPDGWTDIGEWIDSKGKKRKTSDTARYKALGNSIALPPWKWVLKRISAQYERNATMASLFDGIGGFPYLWEQINGKGSCIWASEIEEFPIAVTKERFKDSDSER